MNRSTAIVIVVAALGLLGASYWLFFVRPEQAAERARALAPETLAIASLSGGVEVAGPDGAWRPARAGEHLSARDRIRTDDEGVAELRAADGSTVQLSPGTEARIDELRRELKRLSLGHGELSADVRDDPGRVFEVEVDGHGAVARTRGAKFTANSDGAGAAAVATRRGEVILSARGKEVVIRTGQFARIGPGGAPDGPRPLPESLFLKVQWPAATSNRPEVVVAGQASPGARVKVAGHYVRLDADGHYRANVPLPDGAHELHVSATDLAGHVADEKSPRIVVDTKTDFKIHTPKWK
ncbi:MAG TPA: FecR domain-containing protein [Polyangia bacterium]